MDHTVRNGSRRRARLARTGAGATLVAVLALTFLVGIAAAATPKTASEISTSQDGKHGTFLVADNTVYTLDTGSKTCSAKCEKVWRPVMLPDGVKKATAGDGVDAKKLGTVKASGGGLQVTYDGDRLYWFTKDSSPGDVKGAVSDKWGTGALVVTKAASDSGKSDPGTGGVAF
jgi:predicted lipoprotein with Yx(FWY)xxD motif